MYLSTEKSVGEGHSERENWGWDMSSCCSILDQPLQLYLVPTAQMHGELCPTLVTSCLY